LARNAATATDRASLGSLLPVFSVCSSRTRAASLGCTSTTRFPGGNQLLGQQAAQPGGALHRPGPFRPGGRSGDQLLGLGRQARTRTFPSGSSAAVTATAVCEPLCGAGPDHHCHQIHSTSAHKTWPTVAGMPYTGPAVRSSPLFRATPRQGPTGQAHRSEARHTVICPALGGQPTI
jgi:hypothetical protein